MEKTKRKITLKSVILVVCLVPISIFLTLQIINVLVFGFLLTGVFLHHGEGNRIREYILTHTPLGMHHHFGLCVFAEVLRYKNKNRQAITIATCFIDSLLDAYASRRSRFAF